MSSKPPAALTKDADPKIGHRERLRKRFLAGEAAAQADATLLELLLSYAIVRSDVQPLAKSLLTRFGTLDKVLSAEPAALAKVRGGKDATLALLKLTQHLRTPAGVEATVQSTITPPGETEPPAAAAPSASAPVEIDSAPWEPSLDELLMEDPTEPRPTGERKLQVSNGYLLDAAQLAQVLSFIESKPTAKKITGAQIIEGSGLSTRQVGNLVSMGSALGLITPRTQILTPLGRLIAKQDLFLNSLITLEYGHFMGAGQWRNLVWFEVFNFLLTTQRPMTQMGWSTWLRARFAGEYSDHSLGKHVAHEVRFILDAYLLRNFKKLGLLTETPEKTYLLRRYSALQPLALAAMIYMIGERSQTRLVPFSDLHTPMGSPGRIFGIDSASMRQAVEMLHQREWLRFEVRHGLDQLRLLDGYSPLEFLAAAYENRSPQLSLVAPEPYPEQTLL